MHEFSFASSVVPYQLSCVCGGRGWGGGKGMRWGVG